MNIEQFLAAHKRETEALAAEIEHFATKQREPLDYITYDGFAAQVRMLKNLGVRLSAVGMLEDMLNEIGPTIFQEKSN